MRLHEASRRIWSWSLAIAVAMGASVALSDASAGTRATAAPARCIGATTPTHDEVAALTSIMTPAEDLWDALAKEYCASTATPSNEEFALWWGYNRLLNVAMGAAPPPAGVSLDLTKDADLKRALWVMHIMGNYQANWLWHNGHAKDLYGPAIESSGVSTVAPALAALDPGYSESIARVTRAMKLANHGTDDEVLAYNRFSVKGDPQVPGTSGVGAYDTILQPGHGDAAFFGYDLGFQAAALGVNKPAVEAPDWARVDYDPAKPEAATYRAGDSPFLVVGRRAFKAAASGAEGATAQQRLQAALAGAQPADSLQAQTANGFGTGFTFWTGATNSLRGYSKRQYELVLADGVYIIQWSHSNVLSALAAYASKDATLGRRQARAVTFWKTWVSAYLNTLGGPQPELPEFEFAKAAAPGGSCRSVRTVTVHPRVPAGFRTTKVVARVGGKVLAVRRGRVTALRLTFKGRRAGTTRVTLRITGRLHGKRRTLTDRRSYRLCASST